MIFVDHLKERLGWLTYPARKHLLIVDVALNPGHEMFYILGSRHFGRSLVLIAVLPKVLKSAGRQSPILKNCEAIQHTRR